MKKAAPRSNWLWRAAKNSTTNVRSKRSARGSANVAACYGRRVDLGKHIDCQFNIFQGIILRHGNSPADLSPADSWKLDCDCGFGADLLLAGASDRCRAGSAAGL